MASSRRTSGLFRYARYDEPTAFEGLCATALASIIYPAEGYVLGIDCTDRQLMKQRGLKLVLTNERIIAFAVNPAAPIKRAHQLKDLTDIEYDAGLFSAKLTLSGAGPTETYPVPKRLGREFAETARAHLS